MFIANIFDSLDKFNKKNTKNTKKKKKKKQSKNANVYNAASELYNNLLGIYLINTISYQILKEKI